MIRIKSLKQRITSACAENTLMYETLRVRRKGSPPHARRILIYQQGDFAEPGSPPHARRIPVCTFPVSVRDRITSACAENTLLSGTHAFHLLRITSACAENTDHGCSHK